MERLLAAQDPAALAPPQGGRLLGTVPLGRFDGLPVPPLGRLLGSGLDARLFTDLGGLDVDSLVTPTEQFFVRTAASAAHTARGPWRIRVNGPQDFEITPAELVAQSQPMGTHLLECSGNSDPANFGLISAAAWSGVPLGALLDRAKATSSSLVRVTGFDDTQQKTQTSVPGASWIFAREDLDRAGAFLATGMNGGPLPLDHGAPARLFVPGWYGCACVKWVTSIDIVGAEERPTTQMQEFAERTHQVGPDGAPDPRPRFPAGGHGSRRDADSRRAVAGGRRPSLSRRGRAVGREHAHGGADHSLPSQRAFRAGRAVARAGIHDDVEPVGAHMAA